MLKNKLASIAETVLTQTSKLYNKLEFKYKKHHKKNERPVEFAFVFKHLANIYPDSVLDVGTGKTSLPHMIWTSGINIKATDNIRDYWSFGMVNRHFYVQNDDITKTSIEEKFDMITCISVLEHIKDSDTAVKNMFNLLNKNGHLIITCPYNENEYCPNVYDLEGSTYGQEHKFVTQSYSKKQVDKWLSDNNAEIIEQQYWKFWDGDFWTVGNQIIPPLQVSADEKHQITCLIMRKK